MTKFVSQQDYQTKKAVAAEYGNAAKIAKVEGGWMVFDTWAEYEIWRKQK